MKQYFSGARIAVIAGGLHLFGLLVFYLCLIYAPGIERSQSIWYWMVWYLVDFPVSLLVPWLMSAGIFEWFREMTGSENGAFLLFHGVVGTFWWGALAGGVFCLWSRMTGSVRRV